jgi:hypothetical protein
VNAYRGAIRACNVGVLSAPKVTAERARQLGDGAALSKGAGTPVAQGGIETWMPIGGIGIRVALACSLRRGVSLAMDER